MIACLRTSRIWADFVGFFWCPKCKVSICINDGPRSFQVSYAIQTKISNLKKTIIVLDQRQEPAYLPNGRRLCLPHGTNSTNMIPRISVQNTPNNQSNLNEWTCNHQIPRFFSKSECNINMEYLWDIPPVIIILNVISIDFTIWQINIDPGRKRGWKMSFH